ncbi:MAG: TIGR03619 family F420-dependent LLM class oxidoreductase [Actinomycetota bacterium]|nr:TIGR03619 family F420-dependent LLM class oxidoreductase [Actinomycetota bacterium]
MKFGLHLPNSLAGTDESSILAVARIAERFELDSLWMFDHLFTPVDLDSKYPYSRDGSYPLTAGDPFFDPLGLYGVLAAQTKNVRIATGVLIAAYRHPIVLAKILATIERFAPRRIVLGVGAGWMREEFDAVGVGYERRGARLDEYIVALRTLWSGEPTAFDGDFYKWEKAGFLPAPTAPIPIIVGGHTDAALRRVAKLGDGWAITTGRGQGAGIDAIASRLADLDRFLAVEGRSIADLELVYQTPLWFSEQPHPKMPLTGPVGDIVESIGRLETIGVNTIDLVIIGDASVAESAIQRFVGDVLPQVQKTSA